MQKKWMRVGWGTNFTQASFTSPGLVINSANLPPAWCIEVFTVVKGKMIMQDKMEKERADSKNAVEEYVYEMRDKLSGALSEFMTEAVSVFCFVFPQ